MPQEGRGVVCVVCVCVCVCVCIVCSVVVGGGARRKAGAAYAVLKA